MPPSRLGGCAAPAPFLRHGALEAGGALAAFFGWAGAGALDCAGAVDCAGEVDGAAEGSGAVDCAGALDGPAVTGADSEGSGPGAPATVKGEAAMGGDIA